MKIYKCPKCKTDIDYVYYDADENSYGKLWLESNDWDWEDTITHHVDYRCPECDKPIPEKIVDKFLEYTNEK